MKKQTILITGVNGFIFSNFMQKVLKEYSSEYKFVGIDKLTDNFNYANFIKHNNYKFYLGDISDENFINSVFQIEKPNIIINGAASSFVDASIVNASQFIKNNVLGTQMLCDASIKYGIDKFIQISTDEVYGHLEQSDEPWTEFSQPKPRNPYSASKYGSELMLYAANQTHGLQYNITRSCNVFGAKQPNRNLIPKTIHCIFNNKIIPIHSDGSQTRCWDFVDNKCDAIMYILKNAPSNEIFNFGPGTEMSNLSMVNKICNYFEKGHDLIKTGFERKGIDQRYAINTDKLYSLGYKPKYSFEEGFIKTMEWYRNNLEYLEL